MRVLSRWQDPLRPRIHTVLVAVVASEEVHGAGEIVTIPDLGRCLVTAVRSHSDIPAPRLQPGERALAFDVETPGIR